MRKQNKRKKVFNISWDAWNMAADRYIGKKTFSEIGELFGVSRQRAFQQVKKVREALRRA